MDEEGWFDLVSVSRARDASEVRGEAIDVLLAEIGRGRLVDRVGPATVRVLGGERLVGFLLPSDVRDHLLLRADDVALIAARAVVRLDGSRLGLRGEGTDRSRSITSWLREVQAGEAYVRATTVDAQTVRGRLRGVSVDHVEIGAGDGTVVLALSAVAVWRLAV